MAKNENDDKNEKYEGKQHKLSKRKTAPETSLKDILL